MTVRRILIFFVFCFLSNPDFARAHALDPGYLSIEPITGTQYRIFWRRPNVAGRAMRLEVELPANCKPNRAPAARFDGRAWIASWVASCPDGFTDANVAIRGLEATRTDVLVRYSDPTGSTLTRRLTADQTTLRIDKAPSSLDIVRSYLSLGFDHILEGWDHLLFVLALVLLITDRWRLVLAVTTFTVAHSITLAAATLGWVHLPSRFVEATIALSIIFLANELAHQKLNVPRLSERMPWLITFAFGLLHGFGFSGALLEIGLPRGDIPLALLSFNLGVEVGQLIFIGAVLIIARLITLLPGLHSLTHATLVRAVGAYAIGITASFWFIERIA
ncbi:MAG: HupE/UreJ family protein [Hyphomicrobiaceae bacterium]